MPFVEGVPTVTVQLDKPRKAAHTLGLTNRMLERFGDLDITDASGKMDPKKLLPVFPFFVWASLDEEGRDELTPDRIADMIHDDNLGVIMEALASLKIRSNPEASADAGPTPEGPRLAATG